MERKELQELFCAKIGMEYARFHCEMLAKTAEEIYQNAYRIDCIINLYENLLELSQELEQGTLEQLVLFPDILEYLYQLWMNEEDSYGEELQKCIRKGIRQIEREDREAKIA